MMVFPYLKTVVSDKYYSSNCFKSRILFFFVSLILKINSLKSHGENACRGGAHLSLQKSQLLNSGETRGKTKTADRFSGDPIEFNSQLSKDSVKYKEIQLLSPAPLHGKDLGDPDEDVECVCVDADGVVDGVEFGDTVAPVGMVLSPGEDQVWSMNSSF